jgi:hypothetical protein
MIWFSIECLACSGSVVINYTRKFGNNGFKSCLFQLNSCLLGFVNSFDQNNMRKNGFERKYIYKKSGSIQHNQA